MIWKPYSLNEVISLLSGFQDWFLVGGESIDIYLNRRTREHMDIDVGVLSCHAADLILILQQQGLQVFSATDGNLNEFKDSDLKNGKHNFWISDDLDFKVQVLVYSVINDNVVFHRNPDIKWNIDSFIVEKNGIRILNPLVTFAFKVTTKNVQDKDLVDIKNLMKSLNL